jgi:Family of unknown function (DUF6054)
MVGGALAAGERLQPTWSGSTPRSRRGWSSRSRLYGGSVAHYQDVLPGDVDALIAHLDREIPGGSVSAKREDGSDQRIGDARMVVRVYERYSAMGGNRVSLTVSVLAVGRQLAVTMISSGGSRAVFFKVNTLGESAFLDKGLDALQSYRG